MCSTLKPLVRIIQHQILWNRSLLNLWFAIIAIGLISGTSSHTMIMSTTASTSLEEVVSIQETTSFQSQTDSQLRIGHMHKFTRRQAVGYRNSVVNDASHYGESDLRHSQITASGYESNIALDVDDQSEASLAEKNQGRTYIETSSGSSSSGSSKAIGRVLGDQRTSNLEIRSKKSKPQLISVDENETKDTYRSEIISKVFRNNEKFVATSDPSFRQKLTKGQFPKIFWIGCSDSRVPESVVIKANMGEVFVHRNIANTFQPNDTSLIASLHYAIEHLNITHVVVVGHELCGGCQAALTEAKKKTSVEDATEAGENALLKWIKPLQKIIQKQLEKDPETDLRWVVSANVKNQVSKISNHSVLKHAWSIGKSVTVHGWVYDIGSGKLNDLGISRSSP